MDMNEIVTNIHEQDLRDIANQMCGYNQALKDLKEWVLKQKEIKICSIGVAIIERKLEELKK